MMVKVKAPGSCGELVQGTIKGNNFLITCPIDLYSEVTVLTDLRQFGIIGSKLRLAIDKTLHYLQLTDNQLSIAVKSDLPSGKGMASSSADISAACQAIALGAGKSLTPDEIADIALSIEPTDGIFYPGIMLFDHIHGQLRRSLGKPPEIMIAVFDVGGEVDTLYFNRRNDLIRLNREKEAQVERALEMVITGLRQRNSVLIGRGATLSAMANQKILYKPYLEKMIKISQRFGALGVNAAHSGTVLGIMFDSQSLADHSECIAAVQDACPDTRYIRTVKLIAGGLEKQEGESDEWKACF